MTGKTLKITQAKIHTKRTQIHNYERCIVNQFQDNSDCLSSSLCG